MKTCKGKTYCPWGSARTVRRECDNCYSLNRRKPRHWCMWLQVLCSKKSASLWRTFPSNGTFRHAIDCPPPFLICRFIGFIEVHIQKILIRIDSIRLLSSKVQIDLQKFIDGLKILFGCSPAGPKHTSALPSVGESLQVQTDGVGYVPDAISIATSLLSIASGPISPADLSIWKFEMNCQTRVAGCDS